MIAEKNPDVQVQSTLKGESIAMGFDENSLVHIMSVLTDLYSDPELAVIREYSTNALDAHVEAGQARPIEVTTPTSLAPFFKVKDFGVGLGVEEIREIYSKYGASTKRQTNDQVGMLGLGCKSALTYATQFTMVGIKDGQRVSVAISRDEDGAGHMTVVESAETDEAPGVEIVVPVKRDNSFASKARDFFKYWEPGTVLVNGSEPQRFEGLKVTENIYVQNHNSPPVVVMGNVPYPAELEVGLHYEHSVVAFVDIGDVHFPPARESLQMSSKTKATLERIKADFQKNILSAVNDAIDQAPSKPEAVKAMVEWKRVLPYNMRHSQTAFTYKGEDIPESWDPQLDPGATIKYVPPRSYVLSRCTETRVVNVEVFHKTLFFHGYTAGKFSASQRKKLDKYIEQKGLSGQDYSFALTKDSPAGFAWIDPSQIHDWADVHAIKLPQSARTTVSGRIPGSYDMYINGQFSRGVAANDIDQANPVLYMRGGRYEGRWQANLLDKVLGAYTLVVMPANRVGKFQRDFPKAEHVETKVKALYAQWKKGLSKDDLTWLAMQDGYGAHNLEDLIPDKVDDPDLKKSIKLAKKDLTKLAETYSLFENVVTETLGKWKNPLDKYPLWDGYRFRNHPKDMYIYLNAAYAARKGD